MIVRLNNYVVTEKSILYDIVNKYGIGKSINKIINEMRLNKIFNKVRTSNKSVKLLKGQSIMYKNSHIKIPYTDSNKIELWDNGTYVPLSRMTIMNDSNKFLYIILDKKYTEGYELNLFINPNVKHRISVSTSTPKVHYFTINSKSLPFSKISNIADSIYGIVDGNLMKINYVSYNFPNYNYQVSYNNYIDIFVCSNMKYNNSPGNTISSFGPISDTTMPGMFIMNGDDGIGINSKYYPYISVSDADKYKYVRIFDNISTKIPYSRFFSLPEFSSITDPYKDTTYFNNYNFSDEEINSTDNDATILSKISLLAKEYFNIHREIYNKDNKRFVFVDTPFTTNTLVRLNSSSPTMNISTCLADPSKDLILYNGVMLDEFEIVRMVKINSTKYEERTTGGELRYVVPADKGLSWLDILKISAESNSDYSSDTIKLKGKDIILDEDIVSNYNTMMVLRVSGPNTYVYEIPLTKYSSKVTITDATNDQNVNILLYNNNCISFNDYNCSTNYSSAFINLRDGDYIDKSKDIVFYKRLLTERDSGFDNVEFINKKVSKNNIVSTLKTAEGYFKLINSPSLERVTIKIENMDQQQLNYLDKHVIYLKYKKTLSSPNNGIGSYTFTFIKNTMILCINGRIINPKNIDDTYPDILRIINFPEKIEIIDILFDKVDIPYIRTRVNMIGSHYSLDPSITTGVTNSSKPSMIPIDIEDEKTSKGYYDILYKEYLKDGKIIDILMAIGNDPIKVAKFRESLLEYFPEISMKSIYPDVSYADNKIALNIARSDTYYYDIK